MRHGKAKLKKLARLLETAAKRQNESAEATCAVARCLGEPEEQIEDGLFDRTFGKIMKLARFSLNAPPDFQQAARELIAKLPRRIARASRK